MVYCDATHHTQKKGPLRCVLGVAGDGQGWDSRNRSQRTSKTQMVMPVNREKQCEVMIIRNTKKRKHEILNDFKRPSLSKGKKKTKGENGNRNINIKKGGV